MAVFRLYGDILHPGVVEVEADNLAEAIEKAVDDGDFVVHDEQSDCLGFIFSGVALDENGAEINSD